MNVREIVNRFGGQTALAKELGKGASTVAYWVSKDTIPSKWHGELLDLARQRGIDLTAADLVNRPIKPATTGEPPLPVGQYPGTLMVDDTEIKCYVLDDGRRVISRVGATEFLSRVSGQGDLEGYVSTKGLSGYMPPRWKDELVDFALPEVKHKRTAGLLADTFLDICLAYMRARDNAALTTDRQMEMAKRASEFVYACSKIGLTALIDEVTGYQYERAEDALQFKLKLYLADEMRDWEKTFPDELWYEFGRLTGWDDPISSRPKYWGKLVMELVYEYLDHDVADWLKNNAPTPRKNQNYHQWMNSQFGLKKLTEHIWLLVGVATTCGSMPELRRQMAFKFGKVPLQMTMFTDPPNRN